MRKLSWIVAPIVLCLSQPLMAQEAPPAAERKQAPEEVVTHEATPESAPSAAPAPVAEAEAPAEEAVPVVVTLEYEKPAPAPSKKFDLRLGTSAPAVADVILPPVPPLKKKGVAPRSLIERAIPEGSGIGTGGYLNTAGGGGLRFEGKMGFGLNLLTYHYKDKPTTYRPHKRTFSLLRINPGVDAALDLSTSGTVDRARAEISLGSIGHFSLTSRTDSYERDGVGGAYLANSERGEEDQFDIIPFDYIKRYDRILGNDIEGLAVGFPLAGAARLEIHGPLTDRLAVCAKVIPLQLVLGKIQLNGENEKASTASGGGRLYAEMCGRYQLGEGNGEISDALSIEHFEGARDYNVRTYKNVLEWKNVVGSPVNANYTWSLEQNQDGLDVIKRNQVHSLGVRADF